MGYHTPAEILEITRQKGVGKANIPIGRLLVLSFLGGVYIALGFLAYIRVSGTLPEEWGSLRSFLGACVFPIGLIAVLLAGGELATGNMMVVTVAWIKKSIPLRKLLYNSGVVFVGNLIGSLFTAFFLGHFTGLTEGSFLAATLGIAEGKVAQDFWPALVSGIGCNIFVCLGVWLCFGAKDAAGKILGCWFPVMTFVAIGFQHSVANMFVIPAAMFSGKSSITIGEFAENLLSVYIGNVIGGAVFLGLLYCMAYKPEEPSHL